MARNDEIAFFARLSVGALVIEPNDAFVHGLIERVGVGGISIPNNWHIDGNLRDKQPRLVGGDFGGIRRDDN